MKLETVATDSIRFDGDNARTHSKQNIDAIKGSLTLFGQRKPIVVHKGAVIAGNGTLEAARALGWKEIDIVRTPDDWDADKAKAFALADNRTAELAKWDDEVLLEQLLDLSSNGYTLEDIGFTTPKDNDGKDVDVDAIEIAERYEVIIECASELEQEKLLLRLSDEGLKVRAIVL